MESHAEMSGDALEPACLACGNRAIIDTGHDLYPFACIACGCWGQSADQVEHDLNTLEFSSRPN